MKRYIGIEEVNQEARRVAKIVGYKKLYGIPRGGIPAAFAVAKIQGAEVVGSPEEADYFIDDIFDSGATARRYALKFPGKEFFALFDKTTTKYKGQWLVMPWEATDEHDGSADDIIIRLLQYIGEDPTREGLKETPARVLKAWKEWANGYETDVASIFRTFEDGAANYDELVIVHNIPVVSKCEHHLADIIGHAHVGYIPRGKIVGLSKLARLVEIFARRLQVQERLTNQVADAMVDHLKPIGAGVIIRATHACMSTRGVKIHGSVTTTSAMRGALLVKPAAREEFINLCRMAEQDRRP